MVELIARNPHSPVGMIIDVSEEKAKKLVETGDYEYAKDVFRPEEKVFKKRVVPDESWAEKKIKKWITEQGLDVPYSISNDTKEDVLLRLKDKGHI